MRFRRNVVMRNMEHVAIELACDDPRIVNLITRVCRPSLGNVGVMRIVVMRDVTAELAWDNPRIKQVE